MNSRSDIVTGLSQDLDNELEGSRGIGAPHGKSGQSDLFRAAQPARY